MTGVTQRAACMTGAHMGMWTFVLSSAVYVWIHQLYACAYIAYIYVHTSLCVHLYPNTHIHTHTYIHTYTHTHTQTVLHLSKDENEEIRAAALRVISKIAPTGNEQTVKQLLEILQTDDSGGVCMLIYVCGVYSCMYAVIAPTGNEQTVKQVLDILQTHDSAGACMLIFICPSLLACMQKYLCIHIHKYIHIDKYIHRGCFRSWESLGKYCCEELRHSAEIIEYSAGMYVYMYVRMYICVYVCNIYMYILYTYIHTYIHT